MHEIDDSGLSSHIDKLVEEGFRINPHPFNKLAAWSRVLLQLSTSGHSLGRLEKFDSKLRDADSSFLQIALLHSFILQYGKCLRVLDPGSSSSTPTRCSREKMPSEQRMIGS